MPTGNGDERRNTLHGEPLPLPPDYSSPSDVAGGTVPPRRDNGWLVIAVAAAAVLVIGLGGLLAWMVVRDTWFVQFGAFNDYDNARAEVARHYGAEVLPGSAFGLSSRYVVVRPTESEAEAREVCSHFAEGTCYVRSR